VRTVGRHLVQLGIQPPSVPRSPTGTATEHHASKQAEQAERGKTHSGRARHAYLRPAIDGLSRPAYTEVLPDNKARTAIGFTYRARVFFAAHCITHIHHIVTDNCALRLRHRATRCPPPARHFVHATTQRNRRTPTHPRAIGVTNATPAYS
jgi:hypothetical protein